MGCLDPTDLPEPGYDVGLGAFSRGFGARAWCTGNFFCLACPFMLVRQARLLSLWTHPDIGTGAVFEFVEPLPGELFPAI